jgi:hypothetical protein
MRKKLTYANVMSTLAVVLALTGGAAYAANQLGKNTVGTKQLKKNSVTGAKVKKGTLTGSDINFKKLGVVPEAAHAASADSLPPIEPVHYVGAPGEPPFASGAGNLPSDADGGSITPARFYKDHDGIVHLEGLVIAGVGPNKDEHPVFTLPPGFRPLPGKYLFLGSDEIALIIPSAEGQPFSGTLFATEDGVLSLEGISFRSGS